MSRAPKDPILARLESIADPAALTMASRGFSLCSWELTYWLPDSPTVLAPPLIIQKHDIVPGYPELHRFLDFWRREIEARLNSIRVMSRGLVSPAEFRVGPDFRLH